MNTVKDGCHVIVKRARETRLVKVQAGKVANVGKMKFNFNELIGQPFGLTYEICGKKLLRHSGVVANDEPADNEEDDDADKKTEMEIEDSNADGEAADGQAITSEQLEKMKEKGMTGQEIIAKLVDGCASYSTKTAYAQEKYIAKKQKKYSPIITVYPPTLRDTAEIYYGKDAEKICYLRPDCLAHLLTWANVRFGCQVILHEQCMGLVLAGVLQRLGGQGACVCLHKGTALQGVPCMEAMDLEPNISATLLPVPLDDVMSEQFNDKTDFLPVPREENGANATVDISDQDEEKRMRREQRVAARRAGLNVLKEKKLDSLILVTKNHPLPLLKRLLPRLQLSRPFVVYCSMVQPLLECYNWLREEGDSLPAVNVRLFDSFFRSYQVLPGRTHPEMNQLIASGYILTGTTTSE